MYILPIIATQVGCGYNQPYTFGSSIVTEEKHSLLLWSVKRKRERWPNITDLGVVCAFEHAYI